MTADGSAIFALSPTGDLHEFAIDDSGTEHDATLTGTRSTSSTSTRCCPFGGVLVVTVPSAGTATIAGYRIASITGVGRRHGAHAGTRVER